MRNNSQKLSLNAICINELTVSPGTVTELNRLLSEFFDVGSFDHFEGQLNELLYDSLLCSNRTNESKANLFTTTRTIAELLRGLQELNFSIHHKEGGASC